MSWHAYVFRVTGPLWWGSTDPPYQRASDDCFDIFFAGSLNKWLKKNRIIDDLEHPRCNFWYALRGVQDRNVTALSHKSARWNVRQMSFDVSRPSTMGCVKTPIRNREISRQFVSWTPSYSAMTHCDAIWWWCQFHIYTHYPQAVAKERWYW